MQYMCPIISGKYCTEDLCLFLEDEMTRLASKNRPGIQFSVMYDTFTHKFTFNCETKIDDKVIPTKFALNFEHGFSIDGTKLGFPNIFLSNSDSYTSEEVLIPQMKFGKRMNTNAYGISEISHQKRFVIESNNHFSKMTALVKGYDEKTSDLIMTTYQGQLPIVHGLQNGDIVSLSSNGPTELFVFDTGTGGWAMNEFEGCNTKVGKGVVISFGDFTINGGMNQLKLTIVRVKVEFSESWLDCVDKVINISCGTEPSNFCFGMLPRSIPPRYLGFGKGALQYGIDGSTQSGDLKIGSFIAKAVHSLDHPDYILIYLEEGKKNLSLQHAVGNNTTSPFAKLVLYPMVREERMLPRDTTLLGSEMMNRFTLQFKNPDGSPYHFHNARFSFSLNFIRTND
jgi:hypothetical protein